MYEALQYCARYLHVIITLAKLAVRLAEISAVDSWE